MTEDYSTDDTGEPTNTDTGHAEKEARSLTRRGAIATLAALGLLGSATQSASAASPTLEFGGKYTSDPGSNYGLRLEPSGARFGLISFSSEPDGRGVVAQATGTGRTIGIQGRSDSSSDGAVGVKGFSTATSGRTYGFKGRSDSTGGRGALGIATADSGNTIGLEGRVASPDGYGLATPDDAQIEGLIDTNATDFVVDAGTTTTADARNVVLGHSSNEVRDGAVAATISGGGFDDGSTALPNLVHDNAGTIGGGRANEVGSPGDDDPSTAEYATVAGGITNTATANSAAIGGGFGNTASGDSSTVSGGDFNTASGNSSTVGGGSDNTASGSGAAVPGGTGNTASGENAFAMGDSAEASGGRSLAFGNRAKATSGNAIAIGSDVEVNFTGSSSAIGQDLIVDEFRSHLRGSNARTEGNSNVFIWNDSGTYHDYDGDGTDEGLSADRNIDGSGVTGSNTFHASARGGFRFITSSSTVTYISALSAGWSNTSSRAAKTNFEPVDTEAIVDGVAEMELSTWEYTDDDGEGQGERHIGPMAEDFHDLVDTDVGSSDEHINSINADGMLFAAVQGLSEKLDEKDDRVAELETETDELRGENEQLRERNQELEARLAAIEDHLGFDDTSQPAPADD